MATADEYAAWIVENKDKRGTPAFDTVTKAYQEAKEQESSPVEKFNASAVVEQPTFGSQFKKEVLNSLPGKLISSFSPTALQDAATSRFNAGSEVPQWARNNPNLYAAGQMTREVLGPAIEGGAMVGGTLIGTPAGPAGNVAGGALGYGLGKNVTKLADIALGNAPPETAGQAFASGTKDLLEGATWQAGGNVAAPLIGKGLSWAGGKLADLGQMSKQSATLLAQKALGPDLAEARRILAGSTQRPGHAGQLTSNITNPTWQALVERALARDSRFPALLKKSQGDISEKALKAIAGGNTQTEAMAAQEAAKKALNEELIPTLKVELNAANTAGRLKPALDAESQRMAAAAAAKVQDVRDMTAAGARAAERANTTTLDAAGRPVAAVTSVPGYPRQPGRYTYMGELEKKSDQVAQQAADASLPFGEAARFAKSQADSLAAHGLRPLTPDGILRGLSKVAADDSLAGVKEIEIASKYIRDEMAKRTDANGIISAEAIDALRKNAVNSVIRDMNPVADQKQQKVLAAKVMEKIKPLFVGAITEAGGTGYPAYLEAYASGAQKIAQKKLGAEALRLYETSPSKFVRLVEGNAPKVVEKIFGPGSKDIAREMSYEAMGPMRLAARRISTEKEIAKQASEGQDQLQGLLNANSVRFKLPNFLNPKIAVANRVLGVLEDKLGTSIANELTEALKTGKGTQELLNRLPASQRNEFARIMADPEMQRLVGTFTPGGLLSIPQNQNQGLLAQ